MTDQPLSEISTSRLLDEVISRTDGLKEMRLRLQDAVTGMILRGEMPEFLKDEPRGGEERKEDERTS